MENTVSERDVEQCVLVFQAVLGEIKKVVKGKDNVIETALLAIFAGGNILLEDIPGVGKTTLALAFSRAMQLKYNRVQFTPDVMPSDVTGYSVFRKEKGLMEFVPGAAMCNLLLADEINRTSSKTQAALLQVMEEGKVTVDLTTHETPKPFTVIATQNPFGCAGTQLLPESQLDRFLVRLSMGYPDPASELDILKSKNGGDMLTEIRPILSAAEVITLQKLADLVHMKDELCTYLIRIVAATREHPLVELGCSPRGSIALMKMAKARALFSGRNYATPTDISRVLEPCLAHRMILRPKAKAASVTAEGLVREIAEGISAPRLR